MKPNPVLSPLFLWAKEGARRRSHVPSLSPPLPLSPPVPAITDSATKQTRRYPNTGKGVRVVGRRGEGSRRRCDEHAQPGTRTGTSQTACGSSRFITAACAAIRERHRPRGPVGGGGAGTGGRDSREERRGGMHQTDTGQLATAADRSRKRRGPADRLVNVYTASGVQLCV